MSKIITNIKGYPHHPSFAVWKRYKSGKYDYSSRSDNTFNMFEWPTNVESVADVGCGPFGGIFYTHTFPIMYGVDPMWDRYRDFDLISSPDNVIKISSYAQYMSLPSPVDIVISVNSINHCGDLHDSISTMIDNLKDGGLLFLHLLLHSRKKLEPSHPMPIRSKELDNILKKFNLLERKILDVDPTRNRPRKTYLATVKK